MPARWQREACGLMVLAQMKKAALGSLDRVERIVKLGVFVNSERSTLSPTSQRLRTAPRR